MVTSSTLRRCAVALALAASAAVVAVGSPASALPAHDDLGPTSYSAAGPYAVGERTFKLPSGVPVEVWYPAEPSDVAGLPMATYDVADYLPPFLQQEGLSVTHPSGGVRGVPIARGTFPLVVFSHGFAGFRTQSSALTAALASWGFVVAAPDHPSRNLTKVLLGPAGTTTDVEDLQDTITKIGKRTAAKNSWLSKRVDMKRVGAFGHSAGGSAVGRLAVADKRVDTFIAMGGASAESTPAKPSMVIAATADGIVTLDRLETAYAGLQNPKRIVLIDGAGHLVFSDLCEIGGADGGLLVLAEAAGIKVPDNLVGLATDGCLEPALKPTLAWPAIHHTVVAQFRRVFGIDSSDAALTGLVEAYPGIVSDSRSAQ